jgi:hypothetical protein
MFHYLANHYIFQRSNFIFNTCVHRTLLNTAFRPELMKDFENKTQAIIDLQKRGYDHDFILSSEFIFCVQKSEWLFPDDFEIAAAYSFEDDDPGKDKRIIFAISSVNSDLKGILMTSADSCAKGISIRLWSKLAGHLTN